MKVLNCMNLAFLTIIFVNFIPPSSLAETVTVNGALKVRGCSLVGDGNINVPLNTIEMDALPNIGSVAEKENFIIELSCFQNTQVELTLSGKNKDPYGNGVLKNLEGDGQASGIGVQVLDSNGSPVEFDKAFVTISNATDGVNGIKLFAQYIRTSESAVAGKISTDSDYTLSYN